MLKLQFLFLVVILADGSWGTIENFDFKPIEVPVYEQNLNLAVRETDGSEPIENDDSPEEYLRIITKIEDQTAKSGDKVTFRCRVEGHPVENMTFTWYRRNEVIQKGDKRISIKTKSTNSRLIFSQVYTSDSGRYRCEASNGYRRVMSEAELTVSFNVPPPPLEDEDQIFIEPGKCEMYEGNVCSEYLGGKNVFIDGYSDQKTTEQLIAAAINILQNPELVKDSCRKFAIPALCYYVFPVCAEGNRRAEDRSRHLCREDCEILKYDACKDEFTNPDEDVFMKQIAATANCSHLPRPNSRSNCLKVEDLPRAVNSGHQCYNETGLQYLGTQKTTSVGNICKTWPPSLVAQYKELAGGHNYCRNPGNKEEMPWCFVDENRSIRQICNIAKCSAKDTGSSLLTILIPAVAIPLIIAIIALVFCLCCRKKRDSGQGKDKSRSEIPNAANPSLYELSPFIPSKFVVPEISHSSIIFKEELGEGQYGKVYKGQVLQNPNFMTNFPVAVKTFNNCMNPTKNAEFQREIEVFSALQHPNVACLKAFVSQPNMKCMVFEYTGGHDLHEYLSLHSPNSDMPVKIGSSASSQVSSILDHGDFINMALQIASGMEFLSSNNFVHRDLSTRNVLVYPNSTLKICNLGVVRDCYLASYYRSPQMGEMLPLRWMSPEAIMYNQFSEKSSVWSFGVVLWEIFSYGLQPYCGFSNQEVLEMIPNQQLLNCPDQCPSRVYSVMHECWTHNAATRPNFKDIVSKLSAWQGVNTTSMTSQLARGIHRQLNSAMPDGYHGQYSNSNSSTTYTADAPPRYNLIQNLQDSRMHSGQSGSENFAPSSYPNSSNMSQGYSQQQRPVMNYPQRSPVELIVDMPPVQQSGTQQYMQPGYGMQTTDNFDNPAVVKSPGYYTQSQFNRPRMPKHSSVSSRSTVSGGSAMDNRQQALIQNINQSPQYNDAKGYSADNSFQSHGDEFVVRQHQPNQSLNPRKDTSNVPSATILPYSVNYGVNKPSEEPLKDNSNFMKDNKQRGIETSSSSSSVQAISCDSGLPIEDPDPNSLGSSVRSPLLGPKPFIKPNTTST